MTRVGTFVRSLLILILVGGVGPIALVAVGEWRFGGGSPVHGIPSPDRWSASGLRALFAEPLTDRMLAETAIRIALIVAWAAVLVFIVTVAAETAHMLRHGGHHLPDIRGLRSSQRGARAVAAGLVALLPVLTQGSPVIAGTSGAESQLLVRPTPIVRAISPALDVLSPVAVSTPSTPASPAADRYVVRAGDSVFGIARSLAGPDDDDGCHVCGADPRSRSGSRDGRWRTLHQSGADRRRMGPAAAPWRRPRATPTTSDTRHTVLPGESLWSIADDELGDAGSGRSCSRSTPAARSRTDARG